MRFMSTTASLIGAADRGLPLSIRVDKLDTALECYRELLQQTGIDDPSLTDMPPRSPGNSVDPTIPLQFLITSQEDHPQADLSARDGPRINYHACAASTSLHKLGRHINTSTKTKFRDLKSPTIADRPISLPKQIHLPSSPRQIKQKIPAAPKKARRRDAREQIPWNHHPSPHRITHPSGRVNRQLPDVSLISDRSR